MIQEIAAGVFFGQGCFAQSFNAGFAEAFGENVPQHRTLPALPDADDANNGELFAQADDCFLKFAGNIHIIVHLSYAIPF